MRLVLVLVQLCKFLKGSFPPCLVSPHFHHINIKMLKMNMWKRLSIALALVLPWSKSTITKINCDDINCVSCYFWNPGCGGGGDELDPLRFRHCTAHIVLANRSTCLLPQHCTRHLFIVLPYLSAIGWSIQGSTSLYLNPVSMCLPCSGHASQIASTASRPQGGCPGRYVASISYWS